MTTTETPAEIMRRAAKYMRADAEKATPGPWRQDDNYPGDVIAVRMDPTGQFDDDQETVVDGMLNSDDAAHISGMHPGVGLRVAEWLETEASQFEMRGNDTSGHTFSALNVARAYLGEPAATTGDRS